MSIVIYNNKIIIYPQAGFFNNFTSFSSLSSGSCFTYIDQNQPLERVSSKKWYQVACLAQHSNLNFGNNYNTTNNDEEDFFVNDRAYFASFNYPLSFCYSLLSSLAKKYPNANFRGENQFINYFRKILAQEKRASWQLRSRKYFEKALSLTDLAYEKLSSVLKEKLHKLAEQDGKKIEELPALLAKLAQRNTKYLFSCKSSFLSYMKQVLCKLKSKEEIQEAYQALPRVAIGSYLNAVEASYHKVGPQEHLRRKLASTLPMTVAYHLLNNCNFYATKVDKDKNFIIPSKNKNWAEMLR